MKAKLIVVGGDAKPTEIDLKLPSVIGRGRSATLPLPHPLVSREHCEIYLSEGRLHVRDLGSLNGTYVGNERIEDTALPSGSLLTVGTVTFRAVYEDPEAAPEEDDLSFTVSDPEADDELTVGPEAPLSSRTTAMLVTDDSESSESETDALERILESLNTPETAEEAPDDQKLPAAEDAVAADWDALEEEASPEKEKPAGDAEIVDEESQAAKEDDVATDLEAEPDDKDEDYENFMKKHR